MNVMVYNKYKELLLGLNIEVMKSLEGVYNVDEIIDTFAGFYYDKMIIDITAIRDYQNTDNLQKLAMNINMENVILLLDDSPESESKAYLSKLVSLGIYNFTKNADGINYLLVHPHTYRDVANIHSLQELTPPQQPQRQAIPNQYMAQPANQMQQMPQAQNMQQPRKMMQGQNMMPHQNMIQGQNMMPQQNMIQGQNMMQGQNMAPMQVNNGGNGRLRVIGFKNATMHAGSTSLIYMLKKALSGRRKVAAIEVDKVDFLYFNDREMVSSNSGDLLREITNRNDYDIIFVDLNTYEDEEICTEVYYLVEPSTIMINRMMKKNKGILEKLRTKRIILNKCCLPRNDIATFEYETKLKIMFVIPPVDDRQDNIDFIKRFIGKLNL